MLNLKVIIGSTQPGRAADQVVSWIVPAAGEHGLMAASEGATT
jgi:hypothetical protein